ncbi:MAG: carboxypeptidase-like regulatory domain-containing protein [Candidatus Sulfotelmatobacter sp.]
MRQHRFTIIVFVVFVFALGLFSGFVSTPTAKADNLYGSIRGTVVDPSGAVVPDATLTAKNLATGLSYTAKSGPDGTFSFLQMPIGDYSVKVERSGFKSYTAGHIHLDLDQIFNLRVPMELGTTSETITVEANPAQVETTNMQLGTTVTGQQIADLPLNGRNWTQLMQLQPGVEGGSDRFGTTGNGGGYSTNGSETQQNSFLINGTDTNDISLNTPLVIPSPDAIGEFNLVTSTINPEYGRNSGAIVNAAIKNGTNQFHGDVFEFYRDTFLDAIPWFETTRALFHQNQFGGTLGGPIVKDHAFFFFSYQGRRADVPQPGAFPSSFSGSPPTVFSSAQRTGDFSTSPSFYSAANPEPATSPCGAGYTGPFGPNPLPFAVGGAAAGTPWCEAFPTGVIPTANLNPLAVKLTNQYVPLPNGANNAYEFNPLETATRDQYIYRVDEKLTNKDAIWGYGLYENDKTTDALTFIGANLPGFATDSPAKTYEYTVAWNHTFSPTMLNEARFAYLRFNYNALTPVTTQNPSTYGFTGLTSNQAPQFQELPIMNVSGLFTLGYSDDAPQPRVQNTYQVVDNLSKVMGHHTLKFGFNMDRLEINNPFYSSLNGSYAYNGAGVFSTAVPGADFLLGVPDSFSQGSGTIIRARGREYYSYAQDQWQVRPTLTLTMGVAWDIDTPFKNLYANGEALTSFIPGEQSRVFPTAPVGVVYPGDPGVGPYGLAKIHYYNLAPRLGFAWSPGGSHNWSVRGGIGIYYNRTEEEPTLEALSDPPFSLTTLGVSPAVTGTGPGFANPYVSVNPAPVPTASGTIPVANVGPSPFPFTPPAVGSSPSFAPFEPLGFNVSEYAANLTSPRSTNFNLTVERQIDKQTVATLGYVGAIGRHEEGSYNINPAGQPNPVNGSYNPVAQAAGCTDTTLATCAPTTFQFNPVVYGQFGVFASSFNSNYNSLQAQINRHMSTGLQFQVAYTWSRSFDYTSNFENSGFNGPGFNPWNFAQNYGPSANDAPQRLVVNYIYTLPFYRLAGHRMRMLTDGWTLSGIGTFQHGFPVNVFQVAGTDDTTAFGTNFYSAPNFVDRTAAPLQLGQNPRSSNLGGVPNAWLNPAAFAVPAAGVMGNANRNPFYGPGLNYWDMALEKDIKFSEARSLELRFETFNTFNHANFGSPFNIVGFPIFGEILSTQQITTNGAGRVVQLGAKIYF